MGVTQMHDEAFACVQTVQTTTALFTESSVLTYNAEGSPGLALYLFYYQLESLWFRNP